MTSPIDTASVAIVPDFSAFGREASAGIDRALRGVVGDVRTAFDTVERAASDAGADVGREFQQGGESAERALREISTTARREFAQVQTSATAAGSGLRANLGGALGFVKTALIGLTVAAGTGLAAMTGFGLKSAAQLEQVQVAFNSLLGSAEKGAEVFKGLQQFAAATPFEFPEVAGAAQRFLAFNDAVGLSDDALQPFLTTLGNVASVTGGGAQALNSVTLAMGQIASSGKLTLDNLNQISEALPGFSGVAAIAAATGKTTAQVMDEISKGEINATVGIQALLTGMNKFPGAAGAMEKQAQTLLGVFSTFKDTLSQALVAGFAPVLPAIKQSLTEVTPILGQAIAGLAPVLGQLLAGVLPLLGQLIQAITPILAPLVSALGEGLKAVGPALQPLGNALGQIAGALAPLLPLFAQLAVLIAGALGPVIQALVPVFAELVGSVLPPLLEVLKPILVILSNVAGTIATALLPIVKVLAKVFEVLGPPIMTIVQALADLLMPIISALAPVIGQLLEAFTPILDIIVALIPPLVSIIQAFMPLTDVIVALLPAVVAIVTPLAKLVALIVGFLAQEAIVPLVELLAKVLTLVLSPLELLVPLIESFVGWITSLDWGAIGAAIGGFFVDMWNHILDFFKGIGNWFASLPGVARQHFEAMKNAIIAKVAEVIAFARGIPGRILSAIGSLGGLLVNAGRSVIQGLWNGISAMGGWLWTQVKNFVYNNTIGAAKSILGIGSPSKVFAEQVGRWIPPGIGEGINAAAPNLLATLNGLTANMVGAAQGGGGGITLGAGAVQVTFTGVVPSAAEARRTGEQVASGVAQALARRNVATAVRMR